MKKQIITIGACAASLAMVVSPALAQSNTGTPQTYQAARAAGAASQKVAPPNLLMPADMGGGMYGQRNPTSGPNGAPTVDMPGTTNSVTGNPNSQPASNADNPNGSPTSNGQTAPNNTNSTNGGTTPNTNPNSNPSSPQNGPANNSNNTTSPNTKPGG
jgi:hypothetical protein